MERKFLGNIAGLTGSLALGAFTIPKINSEEEIINQRTNLLTKISNQNPSPHIKELIYDHDHEKFREYHLNYVHEIIETDDFWEEVFNSNSQLKSQNENSLKNFLNKLKTNEIYFRDLRRSVIYSEMDGMGSYLPYINAITTPAKNYAQNEKSSVFFFPLSFDYEEKLKDFENIDIPLNSRLTNSDVHEKKHAEQNALGMQKGDGTRLTKEEFRSMLREVSNHVAEADAYHSTYEFFKNQGDKPHEEIFSLYKLLDFLEQNERYPNIINVYHKTGTYSELEAELVNNLTGTFLERKEEFQEEYKRLGKMLS